MSTAGKITLLLIAYLVASGRARSVADSALHQVTLQLKAIDGLLAEVGKVGHQMPERIAHLANRQTKFRWIDSVYRRSARLLGAMAISQVKLISQRNGPQGAQIDSTLTKIEEKSYQLKTMLIQLKQDKTVPVSYFPTELKELNYNTQIKADSLQQGITSELKELNYNTQIKEDSLQQGITSIVAEQNPNIVYV